MADRIDVRTTIGDAEVLAGALYVTRDHGTFSYDVDYLSMRRAFALAPALPLVRGPQSLDGLGAFSDAAPDRWGRRLLARAANRTSLPEFDCLLGVSDFSRQGATRFFDGDRALSDHSGVPPERELPEIMRIADQVQRDPSAVTDIDARRLFEATGSLGGARPKASIIRRRRLALAKFPKPHGDDWDVIGWEATMLRLQQQLGIVVPGATTLPVLDGDRRSRLVLVLDRFDRIDGRRIPYVSAMTMLEAKDHQGGEWMDLVEAARVHGADPAELWRRAAFGALVGNLDNHLRNHGFLHVAGDWRLAPSFDVNPTPLDRGHESELSLFGEREVSARALIEPDALALFGVDEADARAWMADAATVLAGAEREARRIGVDESSVDVMAARLHDGSASAASLAGAAGSPAGRARGVGGRFRR